MINYNINKAFMGLIEEIYNNCQKLKDEKEDEEPVSQSPVIKMTKEQEKETPIKKGCC
jgi:hypothetical protein